MSAYNGYTICWTIGQGFYDVPMLEQIANDCAIPQTISKTIKGLDIESAYTSSCKFPTKGVASANPNKGQTSWYTTNQVNVTDMFQCGFWFFSLRGCVNVGCVNGHTGEHKVFCNQIVIIVYLIGGIPSSLPLVGVDACYSFCGKFTSAGVVRFDRHSRNTFQNRLVDFAIVGNW